MNVRGKETKKKNSNRHNEIQSFKWELQLVGYIARTFSLCVGDFNSN